MEKQKQEAGFGDMPPPYSTEGHPADTGYPPGYSAGPHQVPPPGSNFATPQGLYAQQAPYVTPGRTTGSVVYCKLTKTVHNDRLS